MVGRYNPDIHHRRSTRLKGYDYAQAGAYFVTICAHSRECLFGEIDADAIILNEFGEIVRDEWLKSPDIRSEIQSGEYVIMPNHFHGIVYIVDHRDEWPDKGNQCRRDDRPVNCPGRGDRPVAPTTVVVPTTRAINQPSPPTGPKPKSLGALMAGFKSSVTKRINEMRQNPGAAVWQRNYHEHVIRNEADYSRIAEYVNHNPRQWARDSLNPMHTDS